MNDAVLAATDALLGTIASMGCLSAVAFGQAMMKGVPSSLPKRRARRPSLRTTAARSRSPGLSRKRIGIG